ncbi:MAG: alpha/beta hydrolase family protein [Limisphaerales bacterium]
MIEVWCIKAWNRLGPPRRRLALLARRVVERVRSRRLGMALTIITPLFLVFWHALVLVTRAGHLSQIVAEAHSPSFGNFRGELMPDHSGTRLLYLEGENQGVSLCFYDAADRKRKLLFHEIVGQPSMPSETFLGWSPDDQFFAYGRRGKWNFLWEIVIGDGHTGKTVAAIPSHVRALSGVWLSPGNLVFMDKNHVLFRIERSQGRWSAPKFFECFKEDPNRLKNAPVRNLTAFDDDSVVWQQGNTIWKCGENSDAAEEIWETTTNALLGFSYSQATGRFLLRCEDKTGQYFTFFDPNRGGQPFGIQRLNAAECPLDHPAFINDGHGYTFLSQNGLTNVLLVKAGDSLKPVEFRWPDQVKGFAASQREIFLVTSFSQGPAEINQYDVASGAVQCVVPITAEHLDYMTNCVVTRNQITDADGKPLIYYLYQPPHAGRFKKHPLILGIHGVERPGFAWASYYEALSEAGFYYAYAEHYRRDFSEWASDALAVFKSLAQRADVDTNRVFLFDVSAGAPAADELLENHPGLWAGAVSWNPIAFPDPSKIVGTRLFIDTGQNDPAFGERGLSFQEDAAKAGVPVTLLIHPASGHILNTLEGGRERLRETLLFLGEP